MALILSTYPNRGATRGSSIARYIDALLASLRAHPELQHPDCFVSDGFVGRDLSATHLISVGGQDDATADGSQETAQLGAQRREEAYSVRVYCAAQTGSEDQKFARDQAFALLRIVEEVLQRDPEMKGPNGGVPLVRWSEVTGSFTLQQTSPSLVAQLVEEGRTVGRWAEVAVEVTVVNRINLSE